MGLGGMQQVAIGKNVLTAQRLKIKSGRYQPTVS